MKARLAILVTLLASAFAFLNSTAQDKKQPPKKDVIPHGQASMPGPALSPQEALKKMQVPPGFRVELVAAEPDIVNPVAMTFDERGRIWITESLEYPKKAAGPGKDRVKVLESTKGDGKFDKITTVIDGLNIPSGIAIGHGGVWLANAPDILFYPFEDFANAKLGKPQVVVTGFGRFDTHELPNSLTWGPDGWLYGLNGVFNRSVVKQDGKTFDFTCALFKIHPKTKKFELFCEGTSNPWGLAFNENGDAFVSACVIDHLWHLTETGYYHRQGGPYPPYTWKIGSIVKHKHQKAAYCGLCWFDSDAYPPEYREKLYMGNIHGNAINCDQLEKDGSTYFAKPGLIPEPIAPKKIAGLLPEHLRASRVSGGRETQPPPAYAGGSLIDFPKQLIPQKGDGKAWGVGPGSNFLLANDAWFMPVVQKVGPDGCLYILDWYDRYHCYQDANRDPAGIDRLKGRLYRVVYKDYKPAGRFVLNSEKSADLVSHLSSPNVYYRETAQRVLSERLLAWHARKELIGDDIRAEIALRNLIIDAKADRRSRLHAFWALLGGDSLPTSIRWQDADPTIRSWSVRAARNSGDLDVTLAKSPEREIQLQVAIAATKAKGIEPLSILLDVLTHCGDDKLIPHIVWQNLHPLLEKDGERFLTLAAKVDLAKSPGVAKVLPRAIDRILGNAGGDPTVVLKFIQKLVDEAKVEPARLCLAALTVKVQNNEIAGKQLETLRKEGREGLLLLSAAPKGPLGVDATILLAALKDATGTERARALLADAKNSETTRVRAMRALVASGQGLEVLFDADVIIAKKQGSVDFRAQVLDALAGVNHEGAGQIALGRYKLMEPELQPKAIEMLTQRPIWAKLLFTDIAAKKISKDVINVNQARRLLATKDKELTQLIEKHWGIPRDGRNPEREKLVTHMKEQFTKTPGDPKAGAVHFKKICAQCHKMYGEGVDVGPDITSNGRADFDQLLSNLFDPSLVIGSGYQSVVVNTKQGQVINGLLVEDNAQRVILKVQGGELKTIARKDVDEQFTSKVSMMPEDLEKQLRPQEIVDLLSYLSLDRSPDDPKARKIPGTPR